VRPVVVAPILVVMEFRMRLLFTPVLVAEVGVLPAVALAVEEAVLVQLVV